MISALTFIAVLLAALLSAGLALTVADHKARHREVSIKLRNRGGFGR